MTENNRLPCEVLFFSVRPAGAFQAPAVLRTKRATLRIGEAAITVIHETYIHNKLHLVCVVLGGTRRLAMSG
jgi:hypothetical protein